MTIRMILPDSDESLWMNDVEGFRFHKGDKFRHYEKTYIVIDVIIQYIGFSDPTGKKEIFQTVYVE